MLDFPNTSKHYPQSCGLWHRFYYDCVVVVVVVVVDVFVIVLVMVVICKSEGSERAPH